MLKDKLLKICFLKNLKINVNFTYLKYSNFLKKIICFNLSIWIGLFLWKKLEICLKQFQVWPRLDIHYEKFDKKLRNKLNFNYENFEGLEKKIRYLIPKLIPNSAIESFHNVMSTVSKMNFPQNPKFIFTSYAHTHDEVFKFL